jgi:hypothetical protein
MTADEGKIYTLDTDWLAHTMTNYPLDIAPEVWAHIKHLIDTGRIIICDPVYQEVLEQEDELSEWLKANIGRALKEPGEGEFKFVEEEIMAHYEETFSNWFTLDDPNGIEADPFLVATAVVGGYVVVTGENKKIMQSNSHLSKTPNVCDFFGVPCICNNPRDSKQSPTVDFLRDSGYRNKVKV